VDNNGKEYLALDVGLKRTGIARASNIARIAQPLLTVNTTQLIKTLKQLTEENETEAIVVGLPRSLSGVDTKQTSWVRDFVKYAKAKIDKPFYWQDEALTTRIAQARKETGSKKIHDIDSLAAAIILQDFLDSSEAERTMC
jgi:putative Holliday junction resolvase